MPDGTGASFLADEDPISEQPASARLVASLALMYLRHDDAPRALALGLAAMRGGAVPPKLALLVAQAFLKTGDAEQALAVLSRFDGDASLLSQPPTEAERASMRILRAKAAFRQGDTATAQALLEQAKGGGSPT